MVSPIWFWQRIVSPHMVGLAEELASTGRSVTYVAEQLMSTDRAKLGWKPATTDAISLCIASDAKAVRALVASAPPDSIHICPGFRGNGVVNSARKALNTRGLRQWIIMETVHEKGAASSILKRIEYSRLVRKWRDRIEGVLAIGHSTPEWLVARGMPSERIASFAYFLQQPILLRQPTDSANTPFRFLFVGRLVELKRIDILIDALAHLPEFSFELIVVGTGPLELKLRKRASVALGDRVKWLGLRPMEEIPTIMSGADCLVLPSRHDGWGAVISEALMVGTPVICSDRCGAAEVVSASGCGGVFKAGSVTDLSQLLRWALSAGKQSQSKRVSLKQWALCLSAPHGAKYICEIFDHRVARMDMPSPPWQVK